MRVASMKSMFYAYILTTHTLIQMPLLPPTHIYISDIYSIYEWQLSDLLIATWAGYTTMLGRDSTSLLNAKKASHICQR